MSHYPHLTADIATTTKVSLVSDCFKEQNETNFFFNSSFHPLTEETEQNKTRFSRLQNKHHDYWSEASRRQAAKAVAARAAAVMQQTTADALLPLSNRKLKKHKQPLTTLLNNVTLAKPIQSNVSNESSDMDNDKESCCSKTDTQQLIPDTLCKPELTTTVRPLSKKHHSKSEIVYQRTHPAFATATTVGRHHFHPGSRRYNRWLNQRLLIGNLRRILYENGESIGGSSLANTNGSFNVWTSSANTHYHAVRQYNGRRINIALGSKDFCSPTVSQWTRLRMNSEIFEAFRKRKELDCFSSNTDDENASAPYYKNEPKCIHYDPELFLKKKILRMFRRLRKLILYGPHFILTFLFQLEDVIVHMLKKNYYKNVNSSMNTSEHFKTCFHGTERDENTIDEDEETTTYNNENSYDNYKKNLQCRCIQDWYTLNYNATLQNVPKDSIIIDDLKYNIPISLYNKHHKVLILCNLSRLHRRLAHLLASLWNLNCFHIPCSNITAEIPTENLQFYNETSSTYNKKELNHPIFNEKQEDLFKSFVTSKTIKNLHQSKLIFIGLKNESVFKWPPFLIARNIVASLTMTPYNNKIHLPHHRKKKHHFYKHPHRHLWIQRTKDSDITKNNYYDDISEFTASNVLLDEHLLLSDFL